jgi:hypothetical protein
MNGIEGNHPLFSGYFGQKNGVECAVRGVGRATGGATGGITDPCRGYHRWTRGITGRPLCGRGDTTGEPRGGALGGREVLSGDVAWPAGCRVLVAEVG